MTKSMTINSVLMFQLNNEIPFDSAFYTLFVINYYLNRRTIVYGPLARRNFSYRSVAVPEMVTQIATSSWHSD